MILPADHREPIPAVIPAIAAVMITVRPALLKIIPVPYLLIPNAVRLVKNAKAVRPEQVHHITERFLRPPNAALVTNAAIPAVPAQQAQAVAPDMKPTMSDRPNAGGATSGTCYKCTKNTNTGNNNNNNTNTGTTTPSHDPNECKREYKTGPLTPIGWCDWCGSAGGPKCIWCADTYECETYGGSTKSLGSRNYRTVGGPYDGEDGCQAAKGSKTNCS